MANTFALILATATLITGVIWLFERFKWAPARQKLVEAARINTQNTIDGKTLAKIGQAPGWIDTGASFFPILAIVFVVRSFVYEPFQIPSGSMMPTLLIGDFILVEKFAYDVKDPITQTSLIKTGKPQRGDVAVFKYPLDTRLDYIKRVIGLPGDEVRYDPISKTLTVYPKCTNTADKKCDALKITYSELTNSAFIQGVEQREKGFVSHFYQGKDESELEKEDVFNLTRLQARNEQLGEQSHEMLVIADQPNNPNYFYRQEGQPTAVWVVPDGHYFMMGDNRDNSGDSRYWGFVPQRNLVGKATAIWMSFEKQEGEWPTGVRFSRIGGIH